MRVCLLNLSFQAETRTVSNLLYVTFNHEMFYSRGEGSLLEPFGFYLQPGRMYLINCALFSKYYPGVYVCIVNKVALFTCLKANIILSEMNGLVFKSFFFVLRQESWNEQMEKFAVRCHKPGSGNTKIK